eukprot:UN13068
MSFRVAQFESSFCFCKAMFACPKRNGFPNRSDTSVAKSLPPFSEVSALNSTLAYVLTFLRL